MYVNATFLSNSQVFGHRVDFMYLINFVFFLLLLFVFLLFFVVFCFCFVSCLFFLSSQAGHHPLLRRRLPTAVPSRTEKVREGGCTYSYMRFHTIHHVTQ